MTVPVAQPFLDVPGFLDFLDKEYLAGYVARGGAAVKLLVPGNESAATEISGGLDSLGDGFAHATVDAATTRVHMIDQVFATVARQLDWVELAAAVVRAAFDRAGFPVPLDADSVGPALSIAAAADYHQLDAAELYRSVRRALEQLVLKDMGLSHEFRVAMLRLCQERLGRGDVTESERETVIGWLRGERVPAGDLRKLELHTKVTRHNARRLLLSLTRWLRLAGHAGLVLRLDLTRLVVSRRPPAGLRDGYYYAKAAALDAYELLRQLIDGTDEFE
ncbi:MAG TPA: BREX system ATP-binding domain-containing protein, partial [Pseudonocardiaceae bacterium]